MHLTQHHEASAEAQPSAGTGVRLTLACPQCDTVGWIEWQSLGHGIRCPKCRCQFLLGPQGQLLSQANLPRTHFACPRCGKSGSFPSMLPVRKAECIGCGLPLVAGPDQRLHGAKEAAQMRRTANASGIDTDMGRPLRSSLTTDDGRLRKSYLGGAVLMLAIVLGSGTMAIRSWLDTSPEKQARRFTRACLTGRWEKAEVFLADDAVQRAEFLRWRMRYFTSIIDEHRPKGDDVDLEVAVLEVGPDTRTFHVRLTSEFLGTRTHRQAWHERDGVWVFDALGTLTAEDGRPASRPTKRTTADERKSKSMPQSSS